MGFPFQSACNAVVRLQVRQMKIAPTWCDTGADYKYIKPYTQEPPVPVLNKAPRQEDVLGSGGIVPHSLRPPH
jgi:hypothetical protein